MKAFTSAGVSPAKLTRARLTLCATRLTPRWQRTCEQLRF